MLGRDGDPDREIWSLSREVYISRRAFVSYRADASREIEPTVLRQTCSRSQTWKTVHTRWEKTLIVNRVRQRVRLFLENDLFSSFLNIEKYTGLSLFTFLHLEIDLFFFEYRDIYWPYLFSRFFI